MYVVYMCGVLGILPILCICNYICGVLGNLPILCICNYICGVLGILPILCVCSLYVWCIAYIAYISKINYTILQKENKELNNWRIKKKDRQKEETQEN